MENTLHSRIVAIVLLAFFLIQRSIDANVFTRIPWSKGVMEFSAGEPFGFTRWHFETNTLENGAVVFENMKFETKEYEVIIPGAALVDYQGILLSTLHAGREEGDGRFKAAFAIEFRYNGRDSELQKDVSRFPLARIYIDEAMRIRMMLSTSESHMDILELKGVTVRKKQ